MEFHQTTGLALLCRVCMSDTSRTDAYTSIYVPTTDPDRPNLHGMLSAICPSVFSQTVDVNEHDLKLSQGMPKTVCPSCTKAIEDAYDLHKRCIESDRKLWEIIMVKQELQDDVQAQGDDPLTDSNDAEGSIKQEVADNASDSDPVEDSFALEPEVCQKKPIKRKPNPKHVIRRTCNICTKVNPTITAFKAHMKKFHPATTYKCTASANCKRTFPTESALESHMIGHATGKPHACPFCPTRFKSYSGLRDHKLKHTSQDAPFKCSICSKGFFIKHSLTNHLLRHAGDKKYACEVCPSRFVSMAEVRIHMSVHTKEGNHICDICGKRFTRHSSLVNHARTVHAGERRYPCTLCNMRFGAAEHLTRHMRTHTGEKPYKCAYCDRAYAQSNDLVKHSKIHVGENPYSCDRCDAAFRLLTDLRDHYKVHWGVDDQGGGTSDVAGGRKDLSKEKVLRFTSQATLDRRYEQEKKLNAIGARGSEK